jgi:hypothetical protein
MLGVCTEPVTAHVMITFLAFDFGAGTVSSAIAPSRFTFV